MELVIFRDPIDEEYRERRTLVEGVVNPLAFNAIAIEVNQLIKR